MSKITYTVRNLLPNSFGIGSIGNLEANAQTSFLVEEDSAEDVLLNQLISRGSLALVSSTPLKTGGGTGADLTAAQLAATQALVSKVGATGVWRNLPASGVIMRVRMTGTGTVSMDSATGDLGAGTVTTAVYSATVSGTQIDDYAYPGDAARSIRFTLTGTAAVEVY